ADARGAGGAAGAHRGRRPFQQEEALSRETGMQTLLSVALSNTVVALFLAVPAVLAGRVWKRPALAHGLWLLLLLKLPTPPLIALPVPWSAPPPPTPEAALAPEPVAETLPVPESHPDLAARALPEPEVVAGAEEDVIVEIEPRAAAVASLPPSEGDAYAA